MIVFTTVNCGLIISTGWISSVIADLVFPFLRASFEPAGGAVAGLATKFAQ
jgi:hypothetical protein